MNKRTFLSIAVFTLAACAPQSPTPSTTGSSSSVAAVTDEQQSSMSSVEETLFSRRLCTRDDFQVRPEHVEEWSTSWNHDNAAADVTLDRPGKGFLVQIPYNPAWGNGEVDCQLSPYEEDEIGVMFGFAGLFEGGGATRFDSIIVKPGRSAAQAIAAITEEQGPDRKLGILPPGTEPNITTINGNTAVRYFIGGFCDETRFEVIGRKFNYVFSSTCNVDSPGINAALESLQIYD